MPGPAACDGNILKMSNVLQFGGICKGNIAAVGVCQVDLISADCKAAVYLQKEAAHCSVITMKVLSTNNM